ncbi:MAG: universal stress protein [Bacteroidota bacterium]
MSNIIVPIDFSADSINALEHAIIFAKKSKSKIKMIHVKKSKEFQVPDYFKDIDRFYGNTVEDYMVTLTNKYKTKVTLEYEITEGKVYKEICNKALLDGSEIIIMGTHGISGFEEFWIGSNSYRVVNNALCPVLTIRNGYLNTEIKKIVVPIDSTNETNLKIPYTSKVAKYFNAEIHLISLNTSNSKSSHDKITDSQQKAFEHITRDGVKCIRDGLFGSNITETTIEYAINIDAQLISIMTEQVYSTKNLWMGNFAQQMVNHSPIPVISFNSTINFL